MVNLTERENTSNIFYYGLLVLMIVVVAGVVTVDTYIQPSPYKVLHFAINYSEGFVRRGLSGELLAWLAHALSIDLVHVIFGLRLFLACGTTLLMFLCFNAIERPAPMRLAFYSPFFTMMPLASWQLVGKMEHLLIFAFALACYLIIRTTATQRRQRIVFILATLLPVFVLSHEIMAFLGGWIVALALVTGFKRKDFLLLAIPLSVSLAAMGTAALFKGTAAQATAICESLRTATEFTVYIESCRDRSPVEFLSRTLEGELLDTLTAYGPVMLPTVPLAFLLVLIALLPLWHTMRQKDNRTLRPALVIGGLVTLPLFLIAHDWGRFVVINLTLMLFVLMVAWRTTPRACQPYSGPPTLLVIAYATCWSINVSHGLVGKGLIVELILRFTEGR